MLVAPETLQRSLESRQLATDLVIVGGGLAGTCAAITAARAGIKVVLIQDRPVLGGNASSEVRLWVLGATSHLGNNNRWAREGGVIDELLVENLHRNPEGNAIIFDTVVLEAVVNEPNVTLLLNTAVFEATKSSPDAIASVRAFCSQNSTMYEVSAPLFCDASGDGVLGFLAGAAFRMGAESAEEFGEPMAPAREYGELLGHSIYFYSKDTGRPVKFIPPAYALRDITKIPRFRNFNTREHGCRLWWIEYGGRLDTVHATEEIKWELWKVVYGVWDHIKNSGQFPDAENLTLEWVGHVPGKRESRRFEGDYMLRQQDLIGQRMHADAVAFGGWSLDLHPADGVFSEKPGCNQWHARGTYQIPYRCLYSRNLANLFIAGRLISASHVAFSSTRVMGTCAHGGQAIGMAAALCRRGGLRPVDLNAPDRMAELQRRLLRTGQHVPGVRLDDPEDLIQTATLTATSHLRLSALPPDGPTVPLTSAWAQMLPVAAGPAPQVTFVVDVAAPTTLRLELRSGDRPDNHTPDRILGVLELALEAGNNQNVTARFDAHTSEPRYLFYGLLPNANVAVHTSQQRLTGILSVARKTNPAVSNCGAQSPPDGLGVDPFEFWTPQRRPGGLNLACAISPPVDLFPPEAVRNGIGRPTFGPNAWVADLADRSPALSMAWQEPQTIRLIELVFDPDFDHPMESSLMGHPERDTPFCVIDYQLLDDTGREVARGRDNHQAMNVLRFDPPLQTSRLTLRCEASHGSVPATVFEVRCYQSSNQN